MPPTVNMGIPGAASSVVERTAGKRVLLAEPRGYCAGVDRAVETVERALEKHGAPIYVRHEIVHNRYVVDTLAKAGAIFVEQTDEVPEGAIVVFSAHGVAPTVHVEAAARNLKTIDATCPLVTKVHNEAKRFARDDYDILLVGHEGHEEVVGTAGEAPDHVQVVDNPDAVDNVVVRDPNKVIWLSQTTLSVDETMETVRRLREKFPTLQDPPSDDICYATQNRQVAVKAMAPECELVIVVGSKNSSNSVRLVEVALGAGSRAAHLVDYAEDIDPAWLDGVTTVGVTSGASVPEILVRGVLDRLAEHGFDTVQPVTTANETLVFALPREIRPARA
ncbi:MULTISPECIES: 4-hydroxy-3-methylbut-2-enyl diphosphate reductase [Mycolicibacterium]|uniref:4-hydroxy-3-methylbut-2-enyl diphosphate reductase n=1 Tax=Mycolicibacterium gilvum (strain PYR-GCK) TaxID=350054 RepID=ISPH_MYCGI|nr:4-hydroxy-3-methylbut-2-enyl diphosphate reductase [Mycolicibacterium sp. PAM1]A4T986.1 RecName: Full=4-hydroxy-3-methylbut-2-enyl diphosphate reductase; Short=HMBPP reductase [Mycolicibacterium gilvum PYR-GCK]ABP44557.1 4-hydroxy-3-methylbut-2-enyl diphosphate reductase [Mycolicibacterium gilvum PYR-GCK]MBV5245936.1 4-hydroxy-3-methylbut-2-enyl diphosphate reductase [Mycolicibacterium sp. PAM1]